MAGILISALLTGCSGNYSVETHAALGGSTWKVTGITQTEGQSNDSEYSLEYAMPFLTATILSRIQNITDLTYEFDDDGTFAVGVSGQYIGGTYTQDGNSIVLTIGDRTASVVVDGDTMIIEGFGATVELKRK